MEAAPWHESPLAFLLGEEASANFFSRHFEKQALINTSGDEGRFTPLLSLARIDAIIANSELPASALNMARKEPPIQRSYFTFANGSIDRGAVLYHFNQGATIILNQLHLADATLADFCRSIQKVFSTRVQANVYLTPPSKQGFNTHYDDHDVFILQIAGKKRWRLYQRPVDKPYRGEKFRAAEHEAGHPEEDFILQSGDCMYVPRGLMHDAQTAGDEPSLHITIGLLGQSWADLMLEAVSEVALREKDFRMTLPPGYAEIDFDKEGARTHFQGLIEKFSRQANFDEVFELMREKYLRSCRPDVSGGLLEFSGSDLTKKMYRLRANAQVLLRHNEQEAVLVSAGGDIHFPASALPGLESVIRGETISARNFTELDSEQLQSTLSKLLAFGIIEAVD